MYSKSFVNKVSQIWSCKHIVT